MTTDAVQLARQRLTHSRLALAQQMSGNRGRRTRQQADTPGIHGIHGTHDLNEDRPSSGNRWFDLGGRAVRGWWHRHPASTVTALAEPVITQYAHRKPLQLLGIAAAIGAAAVVIRPWRLVSMTALLAAGLRASDIASAATALLTASRQQDRSERTHDETSHPL